MVVDIVFVQNDLHNNSDETFFSSAKLKREKTPRPQFAVGRQISEITNKTIR
jgi:hypothetical protein